MNTPLPFGKIAAKMVRMGIPVVPITPGTKRPSIRDWQYGSSTSPNQLMEWLVWYGKESGVGCVATPDGFWFLDADNPDLWDIIERETGQKLPQTYTVASRKGQHKYWRQTPASRALGNRSSHVEPYEFDAQVIRKQVLAPGTQHPSGYVYTVIDESPIVEAPDWLVAWVSKRGVKEQMPEPKRRDDLPVLHDEFDPDEWYDFHGVSGRDDHEWYIVDECPIAGHKHEQSTRTGFYFDGSTWGWKCFAESCPGSKMSIGDVVAFVNKQRSDRGLRIWSRPIWEDDESELEGVEVLDSDEAEELQELAAPKILEPDKLIEKLTDSEPEKQAEVTPSTEPHKTKSGLKSLATVEDDDISFQLVTRSAADYQMEELSWLWPQKIPKGKMILYTGKPDCGKTICTLDVVARASKGADWPDGSKNENGAIKVLLASSEDDPADTLVPRLVAAGANLENVEIVVGTYATHTTKEGEPGRKALKSLNLKRDARMLIDAIRAYPDIQLLVLDPIISYFGDADTNKDKDVRPIMDELKKTCEKSGLTIIGIIHSNKRSDVDAVHKVSGAGSLAAAVRAVWGFSRDTEDRKLYHMAHVKGNLTKDKAGLDYRIEEAIVQVDGKDTGHPKVVWGERFEGDADDLLAAGREQKDKSDYKITIAKAYLRTAVTYPIKAKELYERAEQAEGLTSNNLKKAKVKLQDDGFHIVAKQHHDGWWWYHEEDGQLVKDTAVTVEQVLRDINDVV